MVLTGCDSDDPLSCTERVCGSCKFFREGKDGATCREKLSPTRVHVATNEGCCFFEMNPWAVTEDGKKDARTFGPVFLSIAAFLAVFAMLYGIFAHRSVYGVVVAVPVLAVFGVWLYFYKKPYQSRSKKGFWKNSVSLLVLSVILLLVSIACAVLFLVLGVKMYAVIIALVCTAILSSPFLFSKLF